MARIPKILHYTFGLAPDFGGKPWSLVHYVCLKSAVEIIKPDQVLFYYEYLPTGSWWDLTRKLVTPVHIRAPDEVFGNKLHHVAHRADVVRMQKLIETGGIYLDADVLVQKSFDDLLDHSAVLGTEGREKLHGMANAVILAEPQAPFLRRWFEEYRWFRSEGRDEYWSEHSVDLPSKLAVEHPDEITVLPYDAFFWPLWSDDHLEWIYNSDHPISMDNVYANHLWETPAWKYLGGMTPGDLRRTRSNFASWATPYLHDLPDNYGLRTPRERADRIKTKLVGAAKQLRRRLLNKKN